MAFKMKNASMAKLAKDVSERKQNRIINRMNKLQDKAEKANVQGKDKKAQRKIDKMSKLEDKLLPGLSRPEPTFEGTDEFRSKGEIKRAQRKNKKSSPAKLKEEKGPGQGTKEGQYTGAGIPKNLFNADGKKINTNNLDEGNLSKIKVESGTNRKYVEYVEGPKAGGRLYLSNPK
jgi:hypothetical protein